MAEGFSLGSQKYQSLGWWCLLLGNRDNAYGIPTNINIQQISKKKQQRTQIGTKYPKGYDLYRSFSRPGNYLMVQNWPSSTIDTSDFKVILSIPGFDPSPELFYIPGPSGIFGSTTTTTTTNNNNNNNNNRFDRSLLQGQTTSRIPKQTQRSLPFGNWWIAWIETRNLVRASISAMILGIYRNCFPLLVDPKNPSKSILLGHKVSPILQRHPPVVPLPKISSRRWVTNAHQCSPMRSFHRNSIYQ